MNRYHNIEQPDPIVEQLEAEQATSIIIASPQNKSLREQLREAMASAQAHSYLRDLALAEVEQNFLNGDYDGRFLSAARKAENEIKKAIAQAREVNEAARAERRETKNKIESQGIRQAGAVKKILICNYPGCKARALPLPDGRFIEKCYDHASGDERAEYMKQWNVS